MKRLFLLLALSLFATAARAATSIEALLFEGGAGKDWFFYSARGFELQGKWDATLTSESGETATGELRITLADRSVPSDFIGSFQLNPPLAFGAQTIQIESSSPPSKSRIAQWKLSSKPTAMTGNFDCDGETITGAIAVASTGGSKTYRLRATKKNPIILDMELDPRIADKVQVRILEGSFPEITNAFINYWPIIKNGDVLPINEFLDQPNWEGDSTWRNSFLPGSLEGYVDTQGKYYGVPLPYYAFVMWYNKKIFRDNHWTPPTTWEQLFKLGDEIKKKGIAPIAFQGRYPYYAGGLWDAAYYHLAGPDKWRARQLVTPGNFDCPENAQALALVRRMAHDYFEAGALGMSHTESQLEFFLGKAAMIPCGSWLKSEMKGKIPDGFELGCFNLPIVDNPKGDPTAVNVHVEPFFVLSHSKHPREAVDFFRFMTSRKMAGRFARMQDIPTAIRGANEGNLSKDLDEVVALVNRAKTTYGTVPGEGYPEMDQVYRDAMYEAIARDTPPQQLAADMERQAMAVKNRKDNPDHVTVRHVLEPIILLSLLAAGALWWIWNVTKSWQRRGIRAPEAGLQRLGLGNILLFVAPSVVIYTLFIIIPSLRSFAWSLHEWDGLTNMAAMPFKGLSNFRRLLLESDTFWIAIRNNLFLMFIVPLFVVPLAMFLAATISRGIKGATLFRVVFFFPNLLGGVAATLLWLHLYNPQGGLVNSALSGLGFESFKSFAWLEPKHLYWALIPISIWGACGFNMVLYLAAMETIPESYYEAARIDGASPWRQFWTITLPLIWEVLAISLVFLVIGGMKAFEVIWLLTNQQPQTQTHVVNTLMVQTMFKEFKVGQATAIAVMLFLMVFIGTAATLRGLRRETVEI